MVVNVYPTEDEFVQFELVERSSRFWSVRSCWFWVEQEGDAEGVVVVVDYVGVGFHFWWWGGREGCRGGQGEESG